MAKKNAKEFNFKLYAVAVFFAVLAALVAITYSTYTARYIALHPDRVAENFVDTIVQNGDGYNAYKNTVASKNMKYGDFIRKYYMNPIIYREAGYDPEKGTDGLKGFNEDDCKSEKTLNDDGTLQGQLIERMYPIYEELVSENGWDDYDKIYTEYFNELVKARKELYEDDYISDEIMFTVLEANVLTYGQTLTGTEDTFDENTGVQLTSKKEGVYEKLFGEDCKLSVTSCCGKDIALDEWLNETDKDALATYGISTDDVKEAKSFDVTVCAGDEKVTTVTVTVVKIKSSWYVDNTVTDTSALYEFYEIG